MIVTVDRGPIFCSRGSISRRKEAALLSPVFNALKMPRLFWFFMNCEVSCAPLQTKVPAVLIVTAIYGTNQGAEIDRIAFG